MWFGKFNKKKQKSYRSSISHLFFFTLSFNQTNAVRMREMTHVSIKYCILCIWMTNSPTYIVSHGLKQQNQTLPIAFTLIAHATHVFFNYSKSIRITSYAFFTICRKQPNGRSRMDWLLEYNANLFTVHITAIGTIIVRLWFNWHGRSPFEFPYTNR